MLVTNNTPQTNLIKDAAREESEEILEINGSLNLDQMMSNQAWWED